MTITLYRNNSSSNVANKNIVSLWNGSGQLREPCSILRPTIIIEGLNANIIDSVNYMYIPDFGRYYYATTTAEYEGLTAVAGKVDVLMSWRSAISNTSGVIARQENIYNDYLKDEQIKAYQNNLIQAQAFPGTFPDPRFILIIAGNQSGV